MDDVFEQCASGHVGYDLIRELFRDRGGGQRESETEKEALIMREKETERPTDKVHLFEHSASEHVGHVLLLERFERLANA